MFLSDTGSDLNTIRKGETFLSTCWINQISRLNSTMEKALNPGGTRLKGSTSSYKKLKPKTKKSKICLKSKDTQLLKLSKVLIKNLLIPKKLNILLQLSIHSVLSIEKLKRQKFRKFTKRMMESLKTLNRKV